MKCDLTKYGHRYRAKSGYNARQMKSGADWMAAGRGKRAREESPGSTGQGGR